MKPNAADGVFMPQQSLSSVGAGAVRKAYDAVFDAITLRIKFNLAEVNQVAPEWALARTTSAGKTRVHATGQSGPEDNQELFAFQKVDRGRKIAPYCFSTTNQPKSKR